MNSTVRTWALLLLATALSGCIYDPAESRELIVVSECGQNSGLVSEALCQCFSGHDWCNLRDPDNFDCCPVDTSSVCGNERCDPGESSASCPGDCPVGVSCGDGTCSDTESAGSCPIDCSPADVCGDGRCTGAENERSCAADCEGEISECGDGRCDVGENPANCPGDCRAVTECGDGACDVGESAESCPTDCAPASCTEFGCAFEACLTTCARIESCGVDSATSREECQSDCDWMREAIWYVDSESFLACGLAFGRYEDCVGGLNCGELGAYWEGTGSYCGDQEIDIEVDCTFLPGYVTVTVTEALVSPVKADGCVWDGLTCDGSEDLVRELTAVIYDASIAYLQTTGWGAPIASAAGQTKLREVLSEAVGSAFSAFDKPDPYGLLEVLDSGAVTGSIEVGATQDTYLAPIAGRIPIELLLYYTSDIRLELWDEDFANDDPIGTAEVRGVDLLRAYEYGAPLWVSTAESAFDGILQIKVSVLSAD